MKKIEIIKPDDWHVHFRDKEILKAVVPETSKYFNRALVMPNLVPPILTGEDALNYQKRIEKVVPNNHHFKPLMTIYLTENTNINDLEKSFNSKKIFGAKLYPAGATTNSESGVKNIKSIFPVLEKMSEISLPLLIHGEVTNPEIDIFDREKVFIDTILDPICKKFPKLKITLEHITTKYAVEYVKSSPANLAASITPHHLMLNRNAIFKGGIRPHYYCLPILKKEKHRKALLDVAISGNSKFFLGTDSAPHTLSNKETSCGCAGIFNARYCIQMLAQLFDNCNAIGNLERFVSINGSNHYNIHKNSEKILLNKQKKALKIEKYLNIENEKVVIFDPEFPIYWEVLE
jgi:dihydroorotase